MGGLRGGRRLFACGGEFLVDVLSDGGGGFGRPVGETRSARRSREPRLRRTLEAGLEVDISSLRHEGDIMAEQETLSSPLLQSPHAAPCQQRQQCRRCSNYYAMAVACSCSDVASAIL